MIDLKTKYMKKSLIILFALAMSYVAKAQSVVPTEDGKYPVYCQLKAYNSWGFGKVKVLLDMGAFVEGKANFESLYDENGKKMKFNTPMDAINYMAKRGWKLNNVYFLTESMGKQNVANYILEKRVSSDDEIRKGIITQEEKD